MTNRANPLLALLCAALVAALAVMWVAFFYANEIACWQVCRVGYMASTLNDAGQCWCVLSDDGR